MEILKFKTNMKCEGCVAKVKPQLDAIKEIVNWSVDLKNPDRVLSVEMQSDSPSQVLKALQTSGYKGEQIGR